MVLLWGWDDAAAAAARTPPAGTVLKNRPLPRFEGGKRALLGDGPLDVLVFLRPGQKHTEAALATLTAVRKARGPKVRWTALIPARFTKEEVGAMSRGRSFDLPVVSDTDDAVRSRLGVVMAPAAVLVVKGHKLLRIVPFHKINFGAVLDAHIRHALGELDDKGLARALDPTSERAVPKASSKGRLYVKLGRRALAKGRLDSALRSAKKAVAIAAGLPASHVLLGDVLSAKGDRKGACAAYDAALAIDKADAAAIAGKKRCVGK